MYVKLFGSILDSSIWTTDLPTRVVWITMLAMADEHGVVMASRNGLARRAAVTPAQCRHALKTLSSPDDDDRSGVEGGIRIRELQGGWELVNYQHYRELRSRKQIADAARQARYRKGQNVTGRDGVVTTVTRHDVTVEAEAEGEAEKSKSTTKSKSVRTAPDSNTPLNKHQVAYRALLPIIRQRLWSPDGKPPEKWSEARECTVIAELLTRNLTVDKLAVLIEGLENLSRGWCDQEYRAEWLEDKKVSLRVLFHAKSGLTAVRDLAERAYWWRHGKNGNAKKPHSDPTSLAATVARAIS